MKKFNIKEVFNFDIGTTFKSKMGTKFQIREVEGIKILYNLIVDEECILTESFFKMEFEILI